MAAGWELDDSELSSLGLVNWDSYHTLNKSIILDKGVLAMTKSGVRLILSFLRLIKFI